MGMLWVLLLAGLSASATDDAQHRCTNLDGSVGEGWCPTAELERELDAALAEDRERQLRMQTNGLLADAEAAFVAGWFGAAAGLFTEERQREGGDLRRELLWQWQQAALHVSCGHSQRRARQFTEASTELAAALRLFPRHRAALEQNALLLLDTGAPHRARRVLEDLLRRNRTAPGLLPLLARTTASCSRSSSAGVENDDDAEEKQQEESPLPFALRPGADMTTRVAALHDLSYWRALIPELHIHDADFQRTALSSSSGGLNITGQLVQRLRGKFIRDGYIQLSTLQGDQRLPWAASIGAMGRAVQILHDAGWPVAFLQLYDEAWLIAHQLRELLVLTTGGNLFLGDFAIFHIDPAEVGAAGWGPHRDRGADHASVAFRKDGTAMYHTAWVALTDATPANSCLMVISKAQDAGYSAGDRGRDPLASVNPQAIRAVPSVAGGLVAFTHRLLHWGSATDAPEPAATSELPPPRPRVALSFAVADDGFEAPYFDRSLLPFPAVGLRVALAAGNLLIYSQNEEPGDGNPEVGAVLWAAFESYMHGDGAGGALDGGFVSQVRSAKERLLARQGLVGIDSGDHYAVLGLCVDHSEEELTAAFERRSQLADPEQSVGVGSMTSLRRVHEAYEALQDSELRYAYDYAGGVLEIVEREFFPERFELDLLGMMLADDDRNRKENLERERPKKKKKSKKKNNAKPKKARRRPSE